jgi:hypothetical protein
MSLRRAERRGTATSPRGSNLLLLDSTSFLHGSGDSFASATLRLGMTITHLHLDEVLGLPYQHCFLNLPVAIVLDQEVEATSATQVTAAQPSERLRYGPGAHTVFPRRWLGHPGSVTPKGANWPGLDGCISTCCLTLLRSNQTRDRPKEIEQKRRREGQPGEHGCQPVFAKGKGDPRSDGHGQRE